MKIYHLCSLRNIFTFLKKYMFRIWHGKIYVSKFLKHIFLISSCSRTGKKEQYLLFCNPLKGGGGAWQWPRPRTFSRKKLLYKKKMVLAGFEHYTSNSSRYSANHYSHRFLRFLVISSCIKQRKFKLKEIDLTPRYKIINCSSCIKVRAFILSDISNSNSCT